MPTALQFTPEQTITAIARDLPEAIGIFEEAEIDYSCKGAQSLGDAATNSGYFVDDLIERLNRAKRRNGQKNWYQEPLSAVMAFLIDDHARTITLRLPTIRRAIERAIAGDGDQKTLDRIRLLFRDLSNNLTTHVLKEERELFPYIRDLEVAGCVPLMRIGQRVLLEMVEHEHFRDRLRTLYELANRLPQTSVTHDIRKEIRQFHLEVQRHMHIENNVLYPRAIEIENGLRRDRSPLFPDLLDPAVE